MAGENFSIWNNQIFANAGILANGRYDLAISSVQNNSAGYDSLRLTIEYEFGLSDFPARKWTLTTTVEGNNSESGAGKRWFPIAYQFEPYLNPNKGNMRTLILQPNIIVAEDANGDLINPISPSAFTQVVITQSSSATLQESVEIQEMHDLLGLDIDNPLSVSATQRSAGTITQDIADVAGTVTVQRQ